jgi:uncharacterized membrane protein
LDLRHCCNRYVFLLGWFYVVYGLGFLTLMILVLSDQNGILKVLNSADRFWVNNSQPEIAQEIESELACKCWNTTVCLNDIGQCVN